MTGFIRDHPSNPLTNKVIGAAIEVHRHLGPGLFESVYEACLEADLRRLGLRVRRQVGLPVIYRELRLELGFRMDMVVDDELVVEVKTVKQLGRIQRRQVLTYLRMSGYRAGLILNFDVPYLADGGIRRVLLDR